MAGTLPFVEVLSYETGLPVKVVAWHVRSVRPIREVADDNENVTRIEFTNGDVLDTSDSVPEVVERLSTALAPVIARPRAGSPRHTGQASKPRG
ncbi:MAG TPA: hypothetical protein VGJ81_07840 [Thermoanaerobaculia bacterium]|jgi:hypothetical protein